MYDRTTTFAELVGSNLIEIGAGRPRTVNLNGHDLPILRVANVLDGRIEAALQPQFSDQDMKGEGSKISRPGDVVLTTKGTVGRVALMPPDGPAFAYSPQLCFFRPASYGPLKSRFLYYWFKTVEFWNQANSLKGQTDMADFLSLGDIQQMRIGVPSLERQDAVVGILGALDDKIAANDHLRDTAFRLARSRYAAGMFRESPWLEVRLGDVAAVDMGQSPPGESCNRIGEGMPLLNGPTEFGSYAPTAAQWTTAPTRLSEAGDLLLCVRGSTTGRTNWADRKYAIGRGLAAIRARVSKRHTILAYFGVVERMTQLLAVADGSVFPNLPRTELEALLIPWPDDTAVDNISELLGSLTRLASVRERENRSLAAIRDNLLPGLMSGEIRVRDAEKVMEDVL